MRCLSFSLVKIIIYDSKFKIALLVQELTIMNVLLAIVVIIGLLILEFINAYVIIGILIMEHMNVIHVITVGMNLNI